MTLEQRWKSFVVRCILEGRMTLSQRADPSDREFVKLFVATLDLSVYDPKWPADEQIKFFMPVADFCMIDDPDFYFGVSDYFNLDLMARAGM